MTDDGRREEWISYEAREARDLLKDGWIPGDACQYVDNICYTVAFSM